MSKKAKIIVSCSASVAILVVVLWLAQCVLMPKYMSDIPEGALIGEYYASAGGHDVLFVGDCEVYENFSPVTLWEEHGVSSYIRGSAQQLIWQSYYMLEEMLEYETPQAVVYNVLAMKYGTPQSEAYNRLNLDGMKMSSYKMAAVRASMTEGESALSYVFPLLRYHSRWSEIGAEDFRYMFSRDSVSFAGYLMQTGVRGIDPASVPAAVPLENYELPALCWDYLDRMRQLCEEHGVRLVLIKAPSLYPHWYDEWDAQVTEYVERHGLNYYNLLKISDDIGIDWSCDTYDMGLHLNVDGAEKLSAYFGGVLREECGVTDRRGDDAYASRWDEISRSYYNEKESRKNK